MSYIQPSPYSIQSDTECPLGLKESPDFLLTKFMKSTEIVHPGRDLPPPQKILKEIMNDDRWTRRMLEDWFKQGPPSQTLALTPNPEFRVIYLMLLSILEETDREKSGLGGMPRDPKPLTFEEDKAEEEKLRERIENWTVEHKKWKIASGIEREEAAAAKEEEDEEPKWELV